MYKDYSSRKEPVLELVLGQADGRVATKLN